MALDLFFDLFPGALPQAGMERAVGAFGDGVPQDVDGPLDAFAVGGDFGFHRGPQARRYPSLGQRPRFSSKQDHKG